MKTNQRENKVKRLYIYMVLCLGMGLVSTKASGETQMPFTTLTSDATYEDINMSSCSYYLDIPTIEVGRSYTNTAFQSQMEASFTSFQASINMIESSFTTKATEIVSGTSVSDEAYCAEMKRVGGRTFGGRTPGTPTKAPIGDGMWIILLCAAGYGMKQGKRKKDRNQHIADN